VIGAVKRLIQKAFTEQIIGHTKIKYFITATIALIINFVFRTKENVKMDKNRFETQKHVVNLDTKKHPIQNYFTVDDLKWLVEQAEKVERYERALNDIANELSRYCSEGWTTKALEIAIKSLEV
jgi:hypothetical protein